MLSPQNILAPTQNEIEIRLGELFTNVANIELDIVNTSSAINQLNLSGLAWRSLLTSLAESQTVSIQDVIQIADLLKKSPSEVREDLLKSYQIQSLTTAAKNDLSLLGVLSVDIFISKLKEVTSSEVITQEAQIMALKIEGNRSLSFEVRQKIYADLLLAIKIIEQDVKQADRELLILETLSQVPLIGEKTSRFIKNIITVSKLFIDQLDNPSDLYSSFLQESSGYSKGYDLNIGLRGLEQFLVTIELPAYSNLVSQILDSEDPIVTLLKIVEVLAAQIPEPLKAEAIRDQLMVGKGPLVIDLLNNIDSFSLSYLEELLDINGANVQRTARLGLLSEGTLSMVNQLNSCYHQAPTEDLSLLSLANQYPEYFEVDSSWPSWIKKILDYQDSLSADDLDFRLKLYGVLNDVFSQKYSTPDAKPNDISEFLNLELLIREGQDLNKFFNLQIILEETRELRAIYNVQNLDFIEDLLSAMSERLPLFKISIIANCFICMADENLRDFLCKQLLELPIANDKLNLIFAVTSGYLERNLTDLVDKFLNVEDLSRYSLPEYQAITFDSLLTLIINSPTHGLSEEEIHSRTFVRFVNADRLPTSNPDLIAKMQQDLGVSFKRMYQDYRSFGSLTYDARGPEPLLADFGQIVFHTVEAIHSLDRNSYPGKGFKFSYPKIENLFNLESGKKPLIKYQESWPWLATSLEYYPKTKTYLTRAFKAFANSQDPRLTINHIKYAYLVFNDHYHNYSGQLAFLIPVEILDKELAKCLYPIGKFSKLDSSVLDSKHSNLRPEKILQLGEELELPVYRVGCGTSLAGGFGNVMRTEDRDETLLIRFLANNQDIWGVPLKGLNNNVYSDRQNYLAHQQILAAVEAGQCYSDLFNLTLANFHKGQVVGNINPYYMMEKAVIWQETLSDLGAEKEVFPVLYLANSLNALQAPYSYFTLDTYDLIIRNETGRGLGIYDNTTKKQFKALWDNLVIPAFSTATDLRFYDRRSVKELTPFIK